MTIVRVPVATNWIEDNHTACSESCAEMGAAVLCQKSSSVQVEPFAHQNGGQGHGGEFCVVCCREKYINRY